MASDRPALQILVIVAISHKNHANPRRVEAEKVSMATAVDHGLAGPKAKASTVVSQGWPSRDGAVNWWTSGDLSLVVLLGNRTFPSRN